MKKILAFSGSNSKNSINQRFVKIAAEMIEDAEVEVIDLRDYEAPLYGIDLEKSEGIPQSMLDLKEKIGQYDGFLISTPEHNGSIPAFLKNTIDWLSRISPKVLNDKPVLFLATSPGARGGKSALDHIVAIMPYRGATVVGGFSLGSFNESVQGDVLNKESADLLKLKLSELVDAL